MKSLIYVVTILIIFKYIPEFDSFV